MYSIKYKELKLLFKKSETEFVEKYGSDLAVERLAISTLAMANNDNGWPLAMLRAFRPQFADALGHWTSGGYEDIRKAQEGVHNKCLDEALSLEGEFSCLPLWKGKALHYSKDPLWYDKLSVGRLQLMSFMGCCKPGHTFAYALDYAAVLFFTHLKSARLVGALTKENCEGEVLLPRGATFKVVSVDKANNEIILKEVTDIAQPGSSADGKKRWHFS